LVWLITEPLLLMTKASPASGIGPSAPFEPVNQSPDVAAFQLLISARAAPDIERSTIIPSVATFPPRNCMLISRSHFPVTVFGPAQPSRFDKISIPAFKTFFRRSDL